MRGLLAVSLVVVLCGLALSAERPTQTEQDRPTSAQQRPGMMQQTPGAPQEAMLHKTSKLIGSEVKNAEGENLGKIYDLVLTPDYQQVAYAALSHGGVLGVGAKFFAIPWSAFQVGPAGNLMLPVSKDRLEQAPGFNRDNWPASGSWQFMGAGMMRTMPGQQRSTMQQRESAAPGQGRETYTTEEQAAEQARGTTRPGAEAMAGRAMARVHDINLRRVTHLTGMPVKNQQGEDIGDIEDFVIDARQGQLAYTIISFGGLWGIGEKYAAVPSNAVDLEPRRYVARINADRQTLEAVAFAPDKWPNLADPSYAQRLYERFDVEPYWTVMGYVAPEQAQAAAEKAWGAESAVARQFDATKVKTFEGTVQSVGTFQPEGAAPGMAQGLRLRVQTSDGKLMTVHAGPRWFARQQDFHIMPGDKISVTGSDMKIGWRSVIVASQIKKDGETLQLRNETGQPQWKWQPQGQRQGMQMQQRRGAGQRQQEQQ